MPSWTKLAFTHALASRFQCSCVYTSRLVVRLNAAAAKMNLRWATCVVLALFGPTIVEDKCKPMLRALVGEYAAEDEKKAAEKRAAIEAVEAAQKAAAMKKKQLDDYTDYLDGQMQLKAKFAREETMHDLANKYLIHKHYWKIFVPIQIIVTLAALLTAN